MNIDLWRRPLLLLALAIVGSFAHPHQALAQTKYQTCSFSDPTHCYGIGPGSAGQAYVSNGSTGYPAFSSMISGVTSIGGVTIPATASEFVTGPTTTTPSQCFLSTTTAGLGSWGSCPGGGSPGGSNFELQYNNSGTFGGIALGTLGYPLLSDGSSGTAVFGQLDLTLGVTGLLPVAHGGTGTASPSLVAGTNVTITGAWPNQTVNATGGGGMVYPGVGIANSTGSAWDVSYSATNLIPTSVISPNWPLSQHFATFIAATSGSNFSSPLVNIAGTYWTGSASAVDNWSIQDQIGTGTNPTSSLLFNHTGSSGVSAISMPTLVLATPLAVTSGGSGTTTPSLVAGTNVTITGSWPNQTITASATGATAFSALTGSTNTTAAMLVGTGASLAATGSGTITATSSPLSGLTGLGTGVATALAINVGTAGAPVVNGGALGTPSGGTATNLVGLPIATGVSGLGTGVATFLATPSSANFAAAVTGETGAGAVVFATSPSLVTPTLGAATASGLTLSSITGSTQCLQVNTSGVVAGSGAGCGGAPAFSAITTATNTTATMTVGTGGTLTFSGTGVLNADQVNGATVPASQTCIASNSSGQLIGCTTTATLPFSSLSSATNTTAAMVVGSGASFTTTDNLDLLGSSTGAVTLTTSDAGATNYTATFPANTGTVPELNLAQTFSALQTFGTDISIGGVTAAGATGTGNIVFATSPTFTTPTLGAATASGLTLSAITGSTQCLQVNTSGVVAGSGATCGGGGGSGTVNSGTAAQLAYYASTGTAVSGTTNASITAGALTLGASGTAGSIQMGNATSGTVTLVSVTGALGSATASFPANTGQVAETNLANSWSLSQSFGARAVLLYNPVASTSALYEQGTIFTGGTGTTTWPYNYYNPTGPTAPTTFSTGGTLWAANFPSAYVGNIFDFYVNGGTSVFSVNYQGNAVENALTIAGITGSTQCLHVNTSGVVSGTGSDCGSGGSTAFSALTSSTNTTAAMVVGAGASLATVSTGTIAATSVTGLSVTSGKTLTVSNSLTLAGTDATTMTFPATSQTIAGLTTAQTWGAANTFPGSDILIKGSSTGTTALASANASATNYTWTLPAATDTATGLAATQTLTNKSIAASEVNSGTLAAAQMPALTGDVISTVGTVATSVVKVNGAAVPTSALILGSNSSNQLVAASTVTYLDDTGTTFTIASGTGACATTTTLTGGTAIGSFVCSGTSGVSTAVITLPTANNGIWICKSLDKTTSADTFQQTTWTSTSATLGGTIVSGDVIGFMCGAS